MMPTSWKHLSDTEYERPLSRSEASFYWDSVFSRTADTYRYSEIKVVTGQLEKIIDLANVSRAWTNVKKRFPLLGGRFKERDDDGTVYIVVSEERLQTCVSEEISFCEVSSWEGATRLADDLLLQTDQHLSNDLLARIIIARDTERSDCFYFLFAVTHVITDGISNITITRTFLDELCGISGRDSMMDLRNQLAMSVASEDLNPYLGVSLARIRWWTAIAWVITGIQIAKYKGGHGLPQTRSEKTYFTPAKSRHAIIRLPSNLSTQIIQSCRKQGVTFGNVYPVIGQVATARLLLKRYLLGEIDDAEWEFRKKEPMFSDGPVNLRKFLEPDWQAAGGESHVLLAIGFYYYSMSFLPLGAASQLRPGMTLPPIGDLLTKQRFFFRAKSVRKQAKLFLGNPLLLEICDQWNRQSGQLETAKKLGLQWRRRCSSLPGLSGRFLTPAEQAAASGFVICHGGSSMGDLDRVLPHDYPLVDSNDTRSNIKLQLGRSTSRLRCCPGELYLGAATLHKELHIFVHFDGNVYDEDMTREWLEEVKIALEFYLGS